MDARGFEEAELVSAQSIEIVAAKPRAVHVDLQFILGEGGYAGE